METGIEKVATFFKYLLINIERRSGKNALSSTTERGAMDCVFKRDNLRVLVSNPNTMECKSRLLLHGRNETNIKQNESNQKIQPRGQLTWALKI